ncbi:MAG: GIY-YIG nuclease family protein [Phenylobacterium sp.]|uniref:GIY-YIG nuclease family protein n=1 Tax=Phenylobacterium sp. TaxID=1871053 RepID=UPI002715CC18|nr:GIY-YIG nuclease family protein [Phenylobacterium sp.]MDO8410737.1 GIY-YIG nuclease family protein [Phenylobacterium sp.]
MSIRDHIISEIRRLAALDGGQVPGQILFARETGIAMHQWRGKFWARWGDALTEAGFEPNKWRGRLDSDEVLSGVIAACRHYGRFPTRSELQLYRSQDATVPSDQAIRRHFGTQGELVAALARRAAGDETCADIAAMLPATPPLARKLSAGAAKRPDGSVYLIQSGPHYKIGRSDELERRVKEIRIALPEAATLVHVIATDDPPGLEAYWHRRFAAKRANGEWFRLAPEDVLAFKRRKFQ